jgi:hypothetical protein
VGLFDNMDHTSALRMHCYRRYHCLYDDRCYGVFNHHHNGCEHLHANCDAAARDYHHHYSHRVLACFNKCNLGLSSMGCSLERGESLGDQKRA